MSTSNAWEITDSDIEIVLRSHGCTEDAAEVRGHLDEVAIIKGLLCYADFDEQTASASEDIEKQLIKAGVISGAPKWTKTN